MTTEEILSRLDGGETLDEILASDLSRYERAVTGYEGVVANLQEYIADLIALRDSGTVTSEWWVNNYQGNAN